MDKKMFRSILLLITFTVGLVFVIVRFDDLWHMVRLILSQLTPLFAGLAIAFILSRPCAFFRRTLDRGLKGTPLTGLSLPLAVTLSYVLLIGVVAAIFAFVIPQLTSSVGRFAANLSGYLAQVQVWINDITAWLHLEELDLSDCGVSDITPLAGLTNLTWLDLSSNSISDLTPLSGLTGLTYLNLSGNPIPDYGPVEDRDGLILIR